MRAILDLPRHQSRRVFLTSHGVTAVVAVPVQINLMNSGRYRNDHAELVELRPDKWVLGRYDNDMKIIEEMNSLRLYQPGTNDD